MTKEAHASQNLLIVCRVADNNGFAGIANFRHAAEEQPHDENTGYILNRGAKVSFPTRN
jgi:ferritin